MIAAFLDTSPTGRAESSRGPSSKAYPALFAPGQSREDRISAVHYIRFPLGEEGRAALAAGREAALEVDHGEYRARQVLPADLSEGVSGSL